ncbi:MAG: tetratricopeptide repeat protein [Candidatus Poribacteria bacterium]|nr:tetratricopeptide repeat protein [Candidatus Poribacteria bacterium]
MVAQEQENVPDFKAALAAILIEQALADQLTMVAKQFDKAQRAQLRQAIDLLTEAWGCISRTELRGFRVGWIINRSMAHFHLGKIKETIKDLDTALEIEPLNPDLVKKRAILAFQAGERESAIEFLEKIQSNSEVPEIPIILANFLFAGNRFEEAIAKLNDFLSTNPSSELQEEANRLLIRIYISHGCFTEAQQISRTMRELCPTNIFYLVDAAQISSATGKREETLSQLKKAYDYAQDSEEFLEIVELADQLYIHEQFKEAATLYEKLADTNQNSELTQWLLKSYYNAGEIGKALEICRKLREKYGGPLENVSKIEYEIYEKIGDLNKALALCEAYLRTFPDDADMRIHLAYVYYRLNDVKEFENLLEETFDSKNLPLQSCFNLAHLYQIGSKPEKALEIMYEARRSHFNDADAHLKYFGLFLQVEKQIGELLYPTQVQPGTAIYLDNSGQKNWYIIEKRENGDYRSDELDLEHPLAQLSLGKSVNDKLYLQQNPFGADIRQIADIKSKYVYAFQDTLLRFSERFPGTPGLWSIKLPDSNETDDSTEFRPLLDSVDRQHEATLQISKVYKENRLPIGAFTNLAGGNVLDTWGFLMSSPDLGIRCCAGNLEEKIQALALLENPQLKLVVDLISLITLHCLEAADIVVRAFGKLRIAQSTIDELQGIINERECMWSEREGMTVGKQGDRYVKQIINPEDAKHGIEYLKGIVKWIKENCEVEPCTPALEMNQLDKRELNNMLQPHFIDTLLIANQPDYLLLSDDGHLRLNGVWTQVVLEHCVNKGLLSKAEYDKMTIKLVCSHYYHTQFNSDVLIEAAEQSDWKPVEPYNSLVQVLGGQRSSLVSALNVTADFLCELWEQPILHHQSEYLTQVLLKELTSNRRTREVLILLAEQIEKRFTLYLPVEERILEQIEVYAQKHPF